MFTVATVGNGLSSILNMLYYGDDQTNEEIEQSFYSLLSIHFYILLAALVYFELTFKMRPETPPSAVALAPSTPINLKQAFKDSVADKNLLLVTAVFSLMLGTMFAVANIQGIFYAPYGVEPDEIALFFLITLGSGTISCILTGWILDKTHAYKTLMLICTSAATCCQLCLTLFLIYCA